MKVSLELFDGKPLSASLPKRVTCAIKEIHASTKGPTVTPRYVLMVILDMYLDLLKDLG